MVIPVWRLRLRPASYNGVVFHVDVDARTGGRRVALHEFPKKDTPYAEDMGRKARRFTIAAYVIGANFEDQRDALIEQLEAEGNGQLSHPTFTQYDTVVVETYSVTERREQGGYAAFEITFVEAGQDVYLQDQGSDTPGAVNGAADQSINDTSKSGNDFTGSSDISALA